MSFLGDFATGGTIRGYFNTRKSTGQPITFSGSPALAVYKDDGTTESTAGITLTIDFDSRTGMHLFAIDTSADGSFYSAGSDFRVVVSSGTVDSINVAGSKVAEFSLANRSALRPTIAGRTLDVSSGGEAGIDFANIGSPTSSVNLSGTTIGTVTNRVTANTDQWNGVTVTSATVRADLINIAGAAVSTSTAQIGVNIVNAGGTAWASGSITAGVLASAALNGKGDWNVGKTGYSITQSFPANFASLGINASGHVSRVTLVDTTTTNSDMRGTDNAALASNWTATRAGYLDSVVLAQNANQRTVQITGSNHVASDVYAFQNDVINSAAIAASAVAELQSGLALQATVLLVKSKTDLIVGLF